MSSVQHYLEHPRLEREGNFPFCYRTKDLSVQTFAEDPQSDSFSALQIILLRRGQKLLSSFKFSLHAQIINFQNSEHRMRNENKPKTGKKCVFAVITIKFMYNYLYKMCAVRRAYKYSKLSYKYIFFVLPLSVRCIGEQRNRIPIYTVSH